jgi:hypothetical protein
MIQPILIALCHLDIKASFSHNYPMRTTVNIEDEILAAARVLAAERQVSIGAVLSDLARKGLYQVAINPGRVEGFPVFNVSSASTPLTLERVKKLEDDF